MTVGIYNLEKTDGQESEGNEIVHCGNNKLLIRIKLSQRPNSRLLQIRIKDNMTVVSYNRKIRRI